MIDKCWIKAEWKIGNPDYCETSMLSQDWEENMSVLGLLARALVENAVTDRGADRDSVVNRLYSEINLAMAQKTEDVLLGSTTIALPGSVKPE